MTDLTDLDILQMGLCGLAFLLGGLVKGAVGLGLPMVSVPLLSSIVGVPTAVALMSVPALASNAWQMLQGGYFTAAVRRLWPILVALSLGIALGARLLVSSDPRLVQAMLGTVVAVSALLGHFQPEVTLPRRLQAWLGPAAGLLGGLIGGLSSVFGPPIVVYLVALRLPKDEFVASIALVYFTGTIPLGAVLALHGVLGPAEALLAVLATGPVFAGLLVGQWLRARIDQAMFRRILLVMLLLIGLNLVRRALAG